jgi:hypothetical protein
MWNFAKLSAMGHEQRIGFRAALDGAWLPAAGSVGHGVRGQTKKPSSFIIQRNRLHPIAPVQAVL